MGFLYQTGDRIALLELEAWFGFKSDTSISFDLARRTDPTLIIGWIEVHYPCDDLHQKVHLRAALPAEYLHNANRQQELVSQVFHALGIPRDETYWADFLNCEGGGNSLFHDPGILT